MLNQPLKPAPSFCVKTHNRILWSSSSTRCFCISSSKTVGEMARHSKLHNKAPPFLRSDLFTRTWKFRRRTWVGCLLRVYLYLHGIYQYNIYIHIYTYVCVCVNILYTHMVTHHCSSNSEKATTQSKADHGKGQPPLAKGDGAPHPPAGWQATQSNDEEPLQRFRKRLPGLPWRNDGAKMRARMAKRKRNWPCVCVWCQQLSYIFKNAWCNVLSTFPLIIIVLLQARRNRTWIMVCLATFNSSTIKFEILAWLQGRWGECCFNGFFSGNGYTHLEYFSQASHTQADHWGHATRFTQLTRLSSMKQINTNKI